MTDVLTFINRWRSSEAAERANYQLFLSELCTVLGVPIPDPMQAVDENNAYVFEKTVPLPTGSTGFIDLYKRGCFVLEAKQGSDKVTDKSALSAKAVAQMKKRKKGTAVRGTGGWDTAIEKAKQQAQRYARNLPQSEFTDGGRPPFLIVVDVGHSIDLYAEFTRSGGFYAPFPDPSSHRITLDDLENEGVQDVLRTIWTDPQSLDPSRRSARVTREIADRLAKLAKSLEGHHDPQIVASFLMRSLFTMFAEDVGLLPEFSFTNLLDDLAKTPDDFKPMLEHLWETMNTGGFSVILRTKIQRFNGGLFSDCTALPLNKDQIQLLNEAAQADWRDVEPAIFGTLLERALSTEDRHKLGAHYTPRAYVERLVQPTVIEPLRAEWDAVQAAALRDAEAGDTDNALAQIDAYLKQLATTRVLDPACGSGNFLYVTLELMKRLESEVLEVRKQLGGRQMSLEMQGVRVTPQQFLGIEVNPRAAAIAEIVLWIGYLQWHLRTNDDATIADPVLQAYNNIECRDAVLAWDAVEPLLDANGQPVTRWDGRTMKTHPVTGEDVPDEAAQVQELKYINPREAEWPEAEFIVGNPPFIGTALMWNSLGISYTETLRKIYAAIPKSVDFVMYWWYKSAKLLQNEQIKRFGLITTNSLKQTFSRRILESYLTSKEPISLVYAIPNHPWVDSVDGAAVRIAMTVAERGIHQGLLSLVISERKSEADEISITVENKRGKLLPNITIGADLSAASKLHSNAHLSNRGVMLSGSGFIISKEEAQKLGLGQVKGIEKHIRQYRNGRDIARTH